MLDGPHKVLFMDELISMIFRNRYYPGIQTKLAFSPLFSNACANNNGKNYAVIRTDTREQNQLDSACISQTPAAPPQTRIRGTPIALPHKMMHRKDVAEHSKEGSYETR
jgi:hypothetical protein